MDGISADHWINGVLAVPGGKMGARVVGDEIYNDIGAMIGKLVEGVLCFGVEANDPSIRYYKKLGGVSFHERAKVSYAMTALDSPVYASCLSSLTPPVEAGIIADIGGADGRNAMPWLRSTRQKVVVVDPIFETLTRFHSRLRDEHPDWLDRVVLIEGDARALPLRSHSCGITQAIESLAYLNEEYAVGLGECRRILATDGQLLMSDRDYEGGLLMRLFYFGGVTGLIEQVDNRSILDGSDGNMVRSRSFTAQEYADMAESCGLEILERRGISAFSLVLSYMRSQGKVTAEDERHLPQVHALLQALGHNGRILRSHVLICRPTGS